MRNTAIYVATSYAAFAAALLAQTASPPASKQPVASFYEDDEVRIAIPAGWSRATGDYPSLEPYRLGGAVVAGNSALQAHDRLLLQRDGYTLALAYRTGHASGVTGGRFIEAFNISWLTADQAWTACSGVLKQVARPANRALLFENILIDTGYADVRAGCGIPKELSEWVGEGSAFKADH